MKHKPILKQFIFLFGISFLLLSCGSEQVGPCDYAEYKFRAKITDISPYQQDGKELYHVKLKFDVSSLAGEPQYLEKLKNIEIDSAFVARNHLKKGNIYLGTVNEITSGNCEEMYLSFDHYFK